MNQHETKKPSEALWFRQEAMYPPENTLYLYSDQELDVATFTNARQRALGLDLDALATRSAITQPVEETKKDQGVVATVSTDASSHVEQSPSTELSTKKELISSPSTESTQPPQPKPKTPATPKISVDTPAASEITAAAALKQSESAAASSKETSKTTEKSAPSADLLDILAGKRGPWLIFVVSFLIFAIFSGNRFFRQSDQPHYVFLADALLSGRWHLEDTPAHPVSGRVLDNDWAYMYVVQMKNGEVLRGRFRGMYQGKHRFVDLRKQQKLLAKGQIKGWKRQYYVSFPPLPAFLMAAPMWLLGKLGLDRMRYNDTAFTLFFAALTVALFFLLLQRLREWGYSERNTYENALLTALFGFGTVFFFVAVQGTVWYTALTLGAFCAVAYVYFGLEARHPFWAGLFLGMAFLCRPLLLLAGIFFVIQLLYDREKGWKNPFSGEVLSKAALFVLPLLAVGAGMMYANFVRFGSPMEFGHLYLPAVYDRALQHGLFGFYWLPRNLYAFFLAPPQFLNKTPYILFNAHGMSLFLTTPLFLYLLFARSRGQRPLFAALWLSALFVLLPSLFYQNTGWVTFGNRFSVDYSVFLVVLLAISSIQIKRMFLVLLVWGIVVNAFGALVFGRQFVIDGRTVQFFNDNYYSLNWIHDWLYRTFPFLR